MNASKTGRLSLSGISAGASPLGGIRKQGERDLGGKSLNQSTKSANEREEKRRPTGGAHSVDSGKHRSANAHKADESPEWDQVYAQTAVECRKASRSVWRRLNPEDLGDLELRLSPRETPQKHS
ncbi:hypothetical protein MRX96_002568 [Rhipicephalus microplus]